MFEELRAAIILKLMVAELTLLYLTVARGGGGGGRGVILQILGKKPQFNLVIIRE